MPAASVAVAATRLADVRRISIRNLQRLRPSYGIGRPRASRSNELTNKEGDNLARQPKRASSRQKVRQFLSGAGRASRLQRVICLAGDGSSGWRFYRVDGSRRQHRGVQTVDRGFEGRLRSGDTRVIPGEPIVNVRV